MGVHKPFNQSVYQTSDPVKFAVAEKLNRLGYFTRIVEDFGSDIKSFNPQKGYQEHEVEYRSVWEGDLFPFKTVHIPERKVRLLKEKSNLYYWVVNKEITKALVCNAGECMLQSCLVVVPNKSISNGEEFFNIEISKFKYVSLLDKKLIQ